MASMPTSTVSSRHFYQNDTLLNYARRSVQPVSLQELSFFETHLSAEKMIQRANFVRQELPTRLAHRIYEIQCLPYEIVNNNHISSVYELYYDSFNAFRRFPIIRTIEDNVRFCNILRELLTSHTAVIPHLVMGVIECAGEISARRMDSFMLSILHSRIARRIIVEQHIALTESYLKQTPLNSRSERNEVQVGNVFRQRKALDIVKECDALARDLVTSLHGDVELPNLEFVGHTAVRLNCLDSHLRYIVGEILRNTHEAAVEHAKVTGKSPLPVIVTISDTKDRVIFRFSDRAGGLPPDILPHLWSFTSGPRTMVRHHNFHLVPAAEAIIDELESAVAQTKGHKKEISSLSSLTTRPMSIKLGMGLPMSKIYAEFWGGRLSLQSLEGYGCDVFLHISKLTKETRFGQCIEI
ncbi:branched-chain alpha-ketoacid dehydrogenase kinase [Dipodascopsis uninucleata]